MLYIVGGAARSGKTLLARRMLEVARVPWFSLDVLRAALTKGAPVLNLDFNHEDLEEGERLWPIVSQMFEAMLLDSTSYLVEGSCLRPSDVAALMRKRADKDIRTLFLGFPDASPHDKRAQIDANRIGGNDWFSPLADVDKITQVERMIRDSQQLRDEAHANGLPFFDTGSDYVSGHAEALNFLTHRS
jgi:hypothetical protein